VELSIDQATGGVTVARLSGRLDIDGALAADRALTSLAADSRRLVIDLAAVSFVTSMGLRSLMTCARAVAARGGKMALAGPQPNVLRVLEASGVDQVLMVAPSCEAAAAAMA
jgi:anti-anti-sigma factor